MNVIRFLGRKTVLTTLAACILALVAIQFVLTPQHIHVVCDQTWSADIQNLVTTTLTDNPIRTRGIHALREELLSEVPCLKDITVSYSASLRATAFATGWKPLVLIRSSHLGNKEYVACEKGHVFEKRFFDKDVIKRLAKVSVAGEDFTQIVTTKEFIDTILHMPDVLYRDYIIIWHSKMHINLKHKKMPLSITADCGSIHDNDRYTYVQRIFAAEKKYHYGMKADIRLKDSIVCVPVTKKLL